MGPSLELNQGRDGDIAEGDLQVLGDVGEVVDCDETSVAREVRHMCGKLVHPEEPAETANEGCNGLRGPALVGETNQPNPNFVKGRGASGAVVGVPGETS